MEDFNCNTSKFVKYTVLRLAIFNNNDEVALKLIDKMNPEDLTVHDEEGNTILHITILFHKDEITLKLIDKMNPEDLAVQNKLGRTALHNVHLHFFKYIDKMSLYLIDKMNPEDLEIIDNYAKTALYYSFERYHHTKVVESLIQKKADPCLIRYDDILPNKYREICTNKCGYHFSDQLKDWVKSECNEVAGETPTLAEDEL